MLAAAANAVLFSAPEPSYDGTSLSGHLCWLPWEEETLGHSSSAAAQDGVGCSVPGGSTTAAGSSRPDSKAAGAGAACNRRSDGGGAPGAGGTAPRALPCLWFQAARLPTTILYLHSNAEDLGLLYSTLRLVHTVFQVSVLAAEYPGYGLLKGTQPSEEGCYRAAFLALQYLVRKLGVDYSQVILVGRSMGSGPALYLASRFPVGGVILVNAFASVHEVASRYIGDLFARLSFGETFMNRRMILDVASPVLLIHAIRDAAVPKEHSAALFGLCRARKRLVTPERMHHNSNLFGDPAFFTLPVIGFFRFAGHKGRLPQPPPEIFRPPPPKLPRMREASRPRLQAQGCHSCILFPCGRWGLQAWGGFLQAPECPDASVEPSGTQRGRACAGDPGRWPPAHCTTAACLDRRPPFKPVAQRAISDAEEDDFLADLGEVRGRGAAARQQPPGQQAPEPDSWAVAEERSA